MNVFKYRIRNNITQNLPHFSQKTKNVATLNTSNSNMNNLTKLSSFWLRTVHLRRSSFGSRGCRAERRAASASRNLGGRACVASRACRGGRVCGSRGCRVESLPRGTCLRPRVSRRSSVHLQRCADSIAECATPERLAASATACATAGPTAGSKAFGMM